MENGQRSLGYPALAGIDDTGQKFQEFHHIMMSG
jgi:hypothetical protein